VQGRLFVRSTSYVKGSRRVLWYLTKEKNCSIKPHHKKENYINYWLTIYCAFKTLLWWNLHNHLLILNKILIACNSLSFIRFNIIALHACKNKKIMQKENAKQKSEEKTQKFDCINNFWTFFFAQHTNRFKCIALVKKRTNKLYGAQAETLRLWNANCAFRDTTRVFII